MKDKEPSEREQTKPCEECQHQRSEEEAYARHLAVAVGYSFELGRIRQELKAIKGLALSCYIMLVVIFALLMSQKD